MKLDIDSFKKVFEKAKGNNLVVFLFFLLVSCSLWFTLTMKRIYETDISVSVRVENVPSAVKLENGGVIPAYVQVRGEGTDLFGYLFNDGIELTADYSEFSRKGGRLAIPSGMIRSRIVENLGAGLSFKSFQTDSLVAMVCRTSSLVPVKKNRLDLTVADGCELVSVEYTPSEVSVTAFVDEISSIKEVMTPALVCEGVERDTVFEQTFLPGKYISVKPEKVQVRVDVSRYVGRTLSVPVEYVKFPSEVNLGFLPQEVNVEYEVLDTYADKIKSSDFSVQLRFDDYAYSVILGNVGDLEKKFIVSTTSSHVRNVKVVGVEETGQSAGSKTLSQW